MNECSPEDVMDYSDAILKLGSCEDKTKALAAARTEAVLNTLARVRRYREENIREDLVHTVYEKRLELILKASTVKELKEIMKEPRPRYNGQCFVSSPYSVPEEELIMWSLTSLWGGGPLNHYAYERYLSLFEDYFGFSISRGGSE